MNNILITGAAGFIGSQLAYYLYKNKLYKSLVLIDNMSYGKLDNLQFDDISLYNLLKFIDIRDKEKINQVIKENNIDTIFHIAGIAPLPDCQSNPTEAIDVNINGTVNIFECARIAGVKKIVFASTNALYENVNTFPTKETDLDYNNKPTLIYPNTKFCCELFAKSFFDTYGLSITAVRFANVYGPHIDCFRKQPPFVAYMIKELYYNRSPHFYSSGEQKRDYIYIDDLIKLLIKTAQKTNNFDIVNCSANNSYSVNELFNITKKIMNKNINAIYEPSETYWVKYPSLYNGIYSISEDILNKEVNKYSCCDNNYAFINYNWKPEIDIIQGLTNAINFECKKLKELDEDTN